MTPLTDVLSQAPRADSQQAGAAINDNRAANSTVSGERLRADFAERSSRGDRDRLARELLADREQVGDDGPRQTSVTTRHDDLLNTLTFELRDADTDELLRQVPPEEMVEAARVNRVLGIVVNQRV
ncbi:FlaG protein [Limimonas halophila]|uniref:FlaG protein n=1 Tax=Limimonas halophila TaxID=1082479 RepID=A0A1G7Q2Z9_9PROT|nr:flagellar protein FlaG [Limimonas halophila]SDF92874.1 FlaG protein [Limimonas halophila]